MFRYPLFGVRVRCDIHIGGASLLFIYTRAGIIHRDLKPENFLFKSKKSDKNAPPLEDDLKATDFGLSDFFNEGQIFNEVVGSAYYVAPEVLRRRYGPAADVWSVGVMVYICLCGQPPFWGQTETAIFNEILKGRVNFSNPPWPRISNSAKNLISRMLTMDTRNRITAAQALSHPWVREDGDAPEVPIDISVISHMKKFVGAGKLKKIFMQSVANTYAEDDVRVLRDQFISMDTDGSGTITIDEMRTVLKEQKGQKRTTISDKEIEKILTSMDMDGNGEIDYMEFVSATLASTALTRGEKEAYKRHVRLAFNKFDKDGNVRVCVVLRASVPLSIFQLYCSLCVCVLLLLLLLLLLFLVYRSMLHVFSPHEYAHNVCLCALRD